MLGRVIGVYESAISRWHSGSTNPGDKNIKMAFNQAVPFACCNYLKLLALASEH